MTLCSEVDFVYIGNYTMFNLSFELKIRLGFEVGEKGLIFGKEGTGSLKGRNSEQPPAC